MERNSCSHLHCKLFCLMILKCLFQDVFDVTNFLFMDVAFEKQFAEGDEWTSLCDALASHLLSSGFTLAATLCYICAGNVDKTVDIWLRSLEKDNAGESYSERVQVRIVEFSILYKHRIWTSLLNILFTSKIGSYGEDYCPCFGNREQEIQCLFTQTL